MALIFKNQNTATPKTQRGHSKALPVTVSLDQPGRLRIGHLQTLFAVSHSQIYSLIKSGAIPKPDGKDGGRRPYWKTETIKQVLTA